MKTSIQKQFDILLVAAATGVSKIEALALVKGWGFKTSNEVATSVAQKMVKTLKTSSNKLRKQEGKRSNRKAKTFQRFAGSLVTAVKCDTVDLTSQIREVKAQVRVTKVALSYYIKTLAVAQKAASKVSEVKSKTVGWSVDLFKAMSKDAQAKVALEAAKAAL